MLLRNMKGFIGRTITIGFLLLCMASQNSCTQQDDSTSYQIGDTINFAGVSSVVMNRIEVENSIFVVTEDAYIYKSTGNYEWLSVVSPTDYSSLREVYGVGKKLYIIANDWIDTRAQRLYVFDVETSQYEFAMYIKNYHYANNIFCAVQDRVGGQMNNAFYATATTNNLIEINSNVSYNYVSDNIWVDDENNIHFYVDISNAEKSPDVSSDTHNMQEIIWSVEQSADIIK